jgi:hypothetical protein
MILPWAAAPIVGGRSSGRSLTSRLAQDQDIVGRFLVVQSDAFGRKAHPHSDHGGIYDQSRSGCCVTVRHRSRSIYGNAKTYKAWPLCGILISGAIAAGTLRGLPPPNPVITAMYCFPSALYVTGKP